MGDNMETIAAGISIVIFICTAFNYIVITPLKNLIVNLGKVVESIQRDLQIYNSQREQTEKRVAIIEVKIEELEKKIDKKEQQ